MAEYYSANLSREVMKGMRETAYQCKHNGGIPPLGYDVLPDKTYAINNYEATILKEIFELYAAGNGYSKIIQILNHKGYKTKVGKSFGSNSLHELLINEKYIGTYVFNKVPKMFNGKRNSHRLKPEEEIIRVENGLPAIISKELWDEVSKKMSSNRRSKAANSAKEVYLLSGIIYCGKCECAMTGTRKFSGRNKTLYLSYECSGRKRKRICDMKAVGKEFVEKVVIDQLIRDMFSPKAIDKLADKLASHAGIMIKQISKNIIEFENELNGIEKQIDNLLNAIANGMFHQSMKDKLETLENKKNHLFIRIEEAKIQMAINSPSRENIHAYLEKDADIKNKSLEDQKRIIQTYVQKVVVHDDRINTDTIVNFIGGGEGTCYSNVSIGTDYILNSHIYGYSFFTLRNVPF